MRFQKLLSERYYLKSRHLDLIFSIVQAHITCDYQSCWNESSTALLQWPKPVMNEAKSLNPFQTTFFFKKILFLLA